MEETGKITHKLMDDSRRWMQLCLELQEEIHDLREKLSNSSLKASSCDQNEEDEECDLKDVVDQLIKCVSVLEERLEEKNDEDLSDKQKICLAYGTYSSLLHHIIFTEDSENLNRTNCLIEVLMQNKMILEKKLAKSSSFRKEK